jgi:hypothetical protein
MNRNNEPSGGFTHPSSMLGWQARDPEVFTHPRPLSPERGVTHKTSFGEVNFKNTTMIKSLKSMNESRSPLFQERG